MAKSRLTISAYIRLVIGTIRIQKLNLFCISDHAREVLVLQD